MVSVNKLGLMEPSTQASGVKIEPTARESLSTLTAMFMMVSGQMTRLMDQAFISMSTVRCTKVNGRTIFSTARELKLGQTKASMRANTLLEGSTELELTNGMMAASTRETGGKTRLAESVSTRGLMDVDTKESGWKTIWKARGSTFGMTAECIKGSIKMTRSMVMESTLGQMGAVTKVTGLEANSMVWAPISFQRTAR